MTAECFLVLTVAFGVIPARCTALFDVSALSRVAMERASTAREAIQMMVQQ